MTCSIEGCGGKAVTRGWCNKHYLRWRIHADPLATSMNRDGSTCTVLECSRVASGGELYCRNHMRAWRLYGDPLGTGPGAPANPWGSQKDCHVEGCDGKAIARHLCGKHYARWKLWGDPHVDRREARAALDWRDLDDVAQLQWRTYDRYAYATWPEHPNATANGRVSEHVAVMAAILGRPLRARENVHHINGVRHDNRPANLEVWAKKHPPGQRVSELIAWAHELLEEYQDDMQLWPEHLRP